MKEFFTQEQREAIEYVIGHEAKVEEKCREDFRLISVDTTVDGIRIRVYIRAHEWDRAYDRAFASQLVQDVIDMIEDRKFKDVFPQEK